MSNDPYQPPKADPCPDQPSDFASGDNGKAPPVVTEHLRCTRPWVKFCSLAGFITSGFLVAIPLLTLRGMINKLPSLYLILATSFFLVLAILFVIPSFWLSRYEKTITRLVVSERVEDLEQAVAHQRAFWRHMAIMILIMMVIYLLTVAFSSIVLLAGK